MILIEEKKTTKTPGETSLYISFDYNIDIINTIKAHTEIAVYNKDNKTWEVPISSLSNLLDHLCYIDSIQLNVLNTNDQKVSEINLDINNFKTKPFKYQEEGIKFGLSHDKFLLLDAPGLGKTLQVIYIAEELKRRDKIKHCLIVCGINTLKHNWLNEIKKHSKYSGKIIGSYCNKNNQLKVGGIDKRLEDLNRLDNNILFYITNIETLRDDSIIKALNKLNLDMIVLDECHCCKTATAKQSKNLLKLKNIKYKIGLTGTLLTNSPLDAFMPLKFIEAENSTYTNFKFYYCHFTGPFNNILLGYKHMTELKEQLNKVSLRRTKDILDLPPKNIIHEFIEMEDSQRKFYDDIVNGIVKDADKVNISTANVLSTVIRLRQAIDCPSILTTNNIPSAKVDRAEQLIREITGNDEKVVIFSSFKETLNNLADKIKDLNPLICTGDIKDDVINKNIDIFQTDTKYKVMLCTISKMGTGITLTAANYEIFLSSAWTAAQNLQCEDRCYRIGSNKAVFIYYLWTADSFDKHIKEIVEDKSLISDYVIDNRISNNLAERLKSIIIDLKEEQ